MSGHILVLEMGTPLKIKDLAEELIRLSGLVPYEDIDIVYSGLRLGERKTEIIIGKRERLIETGFEFVQTLQGEESTLKEMEALGIFFHKGDMFVSRGMKNNLGLMLGKNRF